jgi:tetratricopeptide (TPR) repeat protein
VVGFNELGKYLMDRGRYSESIHAFERAVKLDPDFQEPQSRLSMIYSQKNILEAARLQFEGVIKDNPGKIAELMREIDRAQMKKNEPETVSILDKIIQLNAGLANAQYQLSKVYDKQGRTQESKDLLEASVKLNPLQLEAQMRMGHLMERMGNKLKSIEAFQQVLMIDSQNKEAQVELWRLFNKP